MLLKELKPSISLLLRMFFTVLTILSFYKGNSQTSNGQKPNVIIILTDDQGYGDLSCHGNPYIQTPNMDQLYSESVRFTNFHVDPTCAPTRAALMTGKYSHHAGVWHTVAGGNYLRSSEKTMGDVFKASGYKTAMFGKWHLGANYPYRPMDRGFEEWLGNGDGGTGTTDDWFDNDRVNDHYWHNGEREKHEGYAPDVFFNKAMDFVKKDHKKPFFMYLATYLPHDPHSVPDPSLAEIYGEKVPKNIAYFYAGINRIDQNIGKLKKVLETSGKADNTILIFMSDNGGITGVRLYNAGMRGKKTQAYEGGHRVPFFIKWPKGHLAHGKEVKDLTAHIDILPTLVDLCHLNPSPTKFDGRSFKQQLYQPSLNLTKRTLFVENQRTFTAQQWERTAGMTNKWRLVHNTELYDIVNDPGQKNNVINQHPDVVAKIRKEFKQYWKLVSPNDRELPKTIVGHPNDKETYLTPSDWYLPKVPWNHAQVAEGKPLSGSWDVHISESGTYRIEARRWPREANTPICGIPTFSKTIDAWKKDGKVDRLLYGRKMKALPVKTITLEVGKYQEKTSISNTDTHVIFDVKLPKGDTRIQSQMLDANGEVIAGTYYVYITKQD
ncbi:arylsulfatase A-like enzyme [Wenyingzhuangia heitensis]|uniref:Arylsulfatase A-like enzyme n=1 Tax=Wenyingzhuangia heitensis TaxID=1487859 RepID=A0ABX0U4N3_9FLAO|nr:arylsulfatase [Wenyingzhuangia heitensis]NIJ43752.1 arylsulfatase A-like enzyme [Wenyingzhuangia heitensis]